MLVVNASRKDADWEHIESRLPPDVRLLRAPQRGLLALQGPKAADVIARHWPQAAVLSFMTASATSFDGIAIRISRLRLHRRGRLRDFGRGRARRGALAQLLLAQDERAADRPRARATRCAWRPASASTATTSTRRPARSRPSSSGRSRSGAAARAASPARSASRTSWRNGPAPPRRHQAGRPRAGARRHRDPVAAGDAHRRRHLRRLRPERQRPGRHGLRRRPTYARSARR